MADEETRKRILEDIKVAEDAIEHHTTGLFKDTVYTINGEVWDYVGEQKGVVYHLKRLLGIKTE